MTENTKQFKRLIIQGKAAAFVDWANVHGWEKSLKKKVGCQLKNLADI